jgi:hypothetical protein
MNKWNYFFNIIIVIKYLNIINENNIKNNIKVMEYLNKWLLFIFQLLETKQVIISESIRIIKLFIIYYFLQSLYYYSKSSNFILFWSEFFINFNNKY